MRQCEMPINKKSNAVSERSIAPHKDCGTTTREITVFSCRTGQRIKCTIGTGQVFEQLHLSADLTYS
jgi:hypothetical protein